MTWVGIDTTGTRAAKYKAAPIEASYLPTSEMLYGIDQIPGDKVLVVEGILDVWRMGPGAVACFGMGPSDRKIEMLADLDVTEYFIMFDGEFQATQNAHFLGKALRHITGRPTTILEIDQGDPDDLTDQQAEAIRTNIGMEQVHEAI